MRLDKLIGLRITLITALTLLNTAACLNSTNQKDKICGIYGQSDLSQDKRRFEPKWLSNPGINCAVGQANWGNTTKLQAVNDATNEAVGFLVREVSGVTAKVDSVLKNQKTVFNGKTVNSYQQGDYRVEVKGKEVELKVKKRAIWYQGYNVWVLVERFDK